MKTSSTKKVELTNSFAYRALASGYIMRRLLTKALKNRKSNNHALPPNTEKYHLMQTE